MGQALGQARGRLRAPFLFKCRRIAFSRLDFSGECAWRYLLQPARCALAMDVVVQTRRAARCILVFQDAKLSVPQKR